MPNLPSAPTWRQLFDQHPRIPPDKLRWWLSSITGSPLTMLPLDQSPSTPLRQNFEEAAPRLARGEPVQYVCGQAPFLDFDLKVTPDVLIPRPETEQLVILALERLIRPGDRVLDVGTGSGCIAIAIKRALPSCSLTAVDVCEAALSLARQNATDLGADIAFAHANLLEGQPARSADLIIANLPYIGQTERDALPPEVRDFEPPLALFSGNDGTDLILTLMAQAKSVLTPRGTLLLETGENHQAPLTSAALRLGWSITSVPDLANRPRFCILTPNS